jgi:hypothetical protein
MEKARKRRNMQDIYARLAALAASKSTTEEAPRQSPNKNSYKMSSAKRLEEATAEEIAAFDSWREEDASFNPFFAIHETIRNKRVRRGLLPETSEEAAQERLAMWFAYQRLNRVR